MALVGAAWLWFKTSPDTAPQTVVAAQAKNSDSSSSEAVSGLLVKDLSLNDRLAAQFSSAVSLIEQNENNAAIEQLSEIIEQQPYAIEPYINLASLYARSNDIDQASETLKKAIEVNENTAVLFESLQSLYAAQAALAYQRALEINTIDDQSLAVNLPTINTLQVDKPRAVEVALQEKNDQLTLEVENAKKELVTWQNRFQGIEKEKDELLNFNAQLKAASQQQGDSESQLLSALKVELQEAEQKSVNVERKYAEQISELQNESSAKIAALQEQLEQAQEALASVENSNSPVVASVEVSAEENAGPVVTSVVEAVVPDAANTPEVISEEDYTFIAVDLVKAWASSWAEQDVPAYIAFYQDTFRPANGLSNQQWREQRQVRLTNKAFIEVDVDDFKVDDRNTQFVVTFSQHYRSNNVDDKITKRLVFNKVGDDWSQAKIVAEQVISR